MKTAIIGGGKGSQAIMEMIVKGQLAVASLEVAAVVDPNMDAAGMVFAREQGWITLPSLEQALSIPELELVIELTGRDDVLEELYRLIPAGVRVMDHVLARVFWDLENVMGQLSNELQQRTALENELREDRRELQQILDSLPDSVMVMDCDRKLERVNARFKELTGLSAEGLQGGDECVDPFCRKHRGSGHPEETCIFEQVHRRARLVQHVHFEPGNGIEEGYYEITANPIFDEHGNIAKVVETARQITEQVLLKRETEESEERFRQFIDNAHDMITIKDVGGRYLVINPQAATMLGKKPEDCLGQTDYQIFPQKIARILFRKDKIVLEQGEYLSGQEKLTIKGEVRYLDTVRFPVLDYKGDISAVASISRDVTEQKQLQRSLIQSEKLAAVGKLAAGVAHELNNPLTGILTFAEELRMDVTPSDPLAEDYDIIIRETMRCRQIVRDLLDYARLEKPQRQSMDINRIVKRTLSLVQKQATFHDIEFYLVLSENLPEVSIDPNQIQQVFLNLIINAAEAMSNTGRITIQSYLTLDLRKIEVSIEDQGHGIPRDKLQQIFEPFFSTKGHKGNGLGLPVVQGIVEQHNGKIQVESEVGRGSKFRVVLPVAQQQQRRAANG